MTSYRSAPLGLALLAGIVTLTCACGSRQPIHSELMAAVQGADALAVADALEALIDAETDTIADREYAYENVRARADDTAAAQLARAMVTGRLVQWKGLRAASLVGDVERCARRSRDLDLEFRHGAATRVLGTLYVMAPTSLLARGDSEVGLELLDGLVDAHPEAPENHVRLAEAYLALGDPAPAYPHLCYCMERRDALRRDDQRLLARLMADAGTPPCPAAPETGSTAPPGVR